MPIHFRSLVTLGLLYLGIFAHSPATHADVGSLFDSAHQVALDGTIHEGYLLSPSPAAQHETEIKKQLKFAMGYFNGLQGGTQHSDLKVKILGRKPLGDGLTQIRYTAQLLVSWSIYRAIPTELALIVPERADPQSLSTFFRRYRQGCSSEAGSILEGFWYYFRPLFASCPLNTPRYGDLAARIPIRLQRSDINTTGKFPEYGKILEDGQLTATIISGKYTPGATSPSDVGISSYNAIYSGLINALGRPVQSIPAFYGLPGTRYPEVQLKFNLQNGRTALIHLFLVDELANVDEDFEEKYNRLSENADLIIYNGHSGLGDNIDALSQMGRFKPGKYQIFLLNGCDTLSYADDSLFRAHQRVNPGAPATKYMDLITNAMPSLFGSMDEASVTLVRSLLGSRSTYRQILSQIDPYQKAVVMGEEDNRWPQPF